jgi:hypothetical protein
VARPRGVVYTFSGVAQVADSSAGASTTEVVGLIGSLAGPEAYASEGGSGDGNEREVWGYELRWEEEK